MGVIISAIFNPLRALFRRRQKRNIDVTGSRDVDQDIVSAQTQSQPQPREAQDTQSQVRYELSVTGAEQQEMHLGQQQSAELKEAAVATARVEHPAPAA